LAALNFGLLARPDMQTLGWEYSTKSTTRSRSWISASSQADTASDKHCSGYWPVPSFGIVI
jgi:hypothetical protein